MSAEWRVGWDEKEKRWRLAFCERKRNMDRKFDRRGVARLAEFVSCLRKEEEGKFLMCQKL
jgi:hypothetical protein